MSISIKSFRRPEDHPYSTLSQYDNENQKETMLAWMLLQCIEARAFMPIETKHNHPDMVEDGLLFFVADNLYELTNKSIELLYSVYGK